MIFINLNVCITIVVVGDVPKEHSIFISLSWNRKHLKKHELTKTGQLSH